MKTQQFLQWKSHCSVRADTEIDGPTGRQDEASRRF
jgi:hypothetical protein